MGTVIGCAHTCAAPTDAGPELATQLTPNPQPMDLTSQPPAAAHPAPPAANPARPSLPHSCRNATSGSTRAPRRAGIAPATKATPAITPAAPTMDTASLLATPFSIVV